MDEGMGYYANQLGTAVKQADPDRMVTMSFFSPAAVVANDPRAIRTLWMIRDLENGGVANLDFVDLHVYLGWGVTATDQLDAFEIGSSRKPLLLGEFGVYYPQVQYTNAQQAADGLKNLQVLTCAPKYRFNGWVMYTWDTTETQNGERDYYTALDRNGAIRDVLSPNLRPDACRL